MEFPPEFQPEDLLPHQRASTEGVLGGEIFSRDALENAAPENGKATYMEHADAWVRASRGRFFYPKAGGTYYGLPCGRVPS